MLTFYCSILIGTKFSRMSLLLLILGEKSEKQNLVKLGLAGLCRGCGYIVTSQSYRGLDESF